MLQARAHLRSSAVRALVPPAAARRAHHAASSSSSPSPPFTAERSTSAPAAELCRAQRRWEEPQVALLKWSIVHHPRAADRVVERQLETGVRRYSSTAGAPPPAAAPALAQPPPPLASLRPSPAPPPLAPSRPAPAPPSIPATPGPQKSAERINLEALPSSAAQRPLFPPPVKPSGLATAPPPPPFRHRPSTSSNGAVPQPAPAVAPPPEPRPSARSETSDAAGLESQNPVRRPLALPRSAVSGPRAAEAVKSAVHPASFFGPQAHRFPVKVAEPRVLSPIVSLNSLLPPTSSARLWPPARQMDLQISNARIVYSRPLRGRWLSRDLVNGRGRQPTTIDGQPFRRSEPRVGPSHDAFALASPSVAGDIVRESMEVMSYPALPAPFLRPDATPVPQALPERETRLVSTLSRRLVDLAIRQHAASLQIEEALEMFAHAYPGWLPWGSRADRRERTPVADVDEAVVFSLVASLVRTSSTGRARALLEHMVLFEDYVPTSAYHGAWLEFYIAVKDYQAAQAQYDVLAQMPGAPLDVPSFGGPILRRLMRIGKLTATPKVTLYWFKKAQAHGIKHSPRDLRRLIQAFAAAKDVASVAAVWRTVQDDPPKTESDRVLYADMFATCLDLYAEAGVSLRHVSFFVTQALQTGYLEPTSDIYNIVMRVAAEEENFDAAREIMRSMEKVGVRGRTFPAERKHYEALLLALDRQYPHRRKTALQQFEQGGPEAETALESRISRARVDAQADGVLERVLELVHEMKERNIEISGRALVRFTRLLSYRETTRPEAIKLAMALLSTLPVHDEGWSARNKWAMGGSGDDGHARTGSALLIFSALLKALSSTKEAGKYKLALQAFDHYLQLQSSESLSVVNIGLVLSLSSRADETQYIERLWEMAILKATSSSVPVALPSSEDEQSRVLAQPSLLEDLDIKIPADPSHQPFQELLGPAMATLFRVVNQHITPASLLYIEQEWLRVYQLNFGFDAACWSELARAYLGAGRFERGFQIVNDVVLFRHHQLLREFERAHGGRTVPGAPSFAADPTAGDGRLSDEIQRAPAHYQDMVTKSYQLPFAESAVRPLRNQSLLNAMSTCATLYGTPTGSTGGAASSSISTERVLVDGHLVYQVGYAVSWAPTADLVSALEQAQLSIRAEARRQWHEDAPVEGGPDGENPLQRAERFFDNYPRVQHLLALRRERGRADMDEEQE